MNIYLFFDICLSKRMGVKGSDAAQELENFVVLFP